MCWIWLSSRAGRRVEGLSFDDESREAVDTFERRVKEAGVQGAGLEHALFLEPGVRA
jgi:hypothetical protein